MTENYFPFHSPLLFTPILLTTLTFPIYTFLFLSFCPSFFSHSLIISFPLSFSSLYSSSFFSSPSFHALNPSFSFDISLHFLFLSYLPSFYFSPSPFPRVLASRPFAFHSRFFTNDCALIVTISQQQNILERSVKESQQREKIGLQREVTMISSIGFKANTSTLLVQSQIMVYFCHIHSESKTI